MEAARRDGQPKEFTWGDLVVLVKPHATSGDKMDVAYTPASLSGVSERYKIAARLMVIGWRGFTRDGKAVEYAPWELDNVPDIRREDGKLELFSEKLGRYIWANTDISGREDSDLKNASALQSSGEAVSDPSTASAKAA